MKIAYLLLEEDFSVESGVLKKISAQIRAWVSYDYEVTLFVISDNTKIWEGIRDLSIIICKSEKSTIMTSITGKKSLLHKIIEWKPDIIYARFAVKYQLLKPIMKKYPTIIEINSDDIVEFKRFNKPDKRTFAKYKYRRNRILKMAKGFVFVTHELADRFIEFGKQRTVVANGIPLNNFKVLPPTNNTTPHLVFIGTKDAFWHGVEKIAVMAKSFPDWKFDIIGFEGFDDGSAIPPNVRFHGHISRDQYEKILPGYDVAIGTLSLYEKNMQEACPLKVREYLAYGLPVINGYKDSDFPNGAPFLLQLPNTLTNVEENLETLREFVQNWMGKRVERKYIEPIDVAMKEKERLAFFERVIIE
ncbi:MAG: glycosyltransferase family 4 protein [Euryarchaeota archaeon]|nr:glycosyltransferase family 4 protein [Euryarchaeota archaeon]MBU4038115.1 glycosyltransferase [Pseudomonadota bacterium]